MNKFKTSLLATLGSGAYFIVFTICVLYCIFPLLMFEMNWILMIVLASAVYWALDKIPFAGELLWTVGLIGAIIGEQDTFAVIYYILYVIIISYSIVSVVKYYSNK